MKMSGRLKLLFVCAVLCGLVLAAFGPQAVLANEEDEADLLEIEFAEARIKAINDAAQAIASIQHVQYLGLHHQASVELARMLADIAIEEYGALETDIPSYSKLLEAEEKLAKLTAIKVAQEAIDALPPVAELTWADRAAVEAARVLVNIAMFEYGATEFDLCWRFRMLQEAEDRIDDLDEPEPEPEPAPAPIDDGDQRPLPPTGGMWLYIPAGLLAIGFGTLAINKRMRK